MATFDRLGVQLTLSGQRNVSQAGPTSDGYRDGDLDGLALVIAGGAGGTIQVGADAIAIDRIELNIAGATRPTS